MKAVYQMEAPGSLPATRTASEADVDTEQRPLSWPLSAAVIVGLSLGLWVLAYRLLRLLFGF